MKLQCPFCLLINLVLPEVERPLCNHCGLDLSRHRGGVTFETPEIAGGEGQPLETLLLPGVVGSAASPGASALQSAVSPRSLPIPVAPRHWTVERDDIGEDHTVVVAQEESPARLSWVLEFENGVTFALDHDVIVVGRRPTATGDMAALIVPDPTKTLSKHHARLRRHNEGWTVDDLGSANGTAVVSRDGAVVVVQQHVATHVHEYLQLGMSRARIRRRADSDTPTGASRQ